MNTFRIVSKLEIKNKNLVKGINYEGLRALGPVSLYAKEYYEDGIDEIIYQDIVASLYGKNNILNLVNETAKYIFVPMCVGGGVRSLKDIENLLKAGADKVTLNTALIKNPKLLNKAVREFGSSTINVSIEVTRDHNNQIIIMYENGRTKANLNIFDWIEKIQDDGAGEMTINFVNKDGYLNGTDIEFLYLFKNKINIPFLVSGGISSEDQILYIAKKFKYVSGIVLSSLLHYSKLNQINHKMNKFVKSSSEGNYNYLIQNHEQTKIINVKHIKNFLKQNSIRCRI